MKLTQSTTFINYLRLCVVLLCISLGITVVGGSRRPAVAASTNLVWAPYLQQIAPDSVVLLWTTHSGTTSAIRYSTDISYDQIVTGSVRTLAAPGTILNRVALSGLQPATTYNYKVYTDDQDLLPNQTLTFRTPPLRGDPNRFVFLAFGDFGIPQPSQRALRDEMRRDTFDFIVTTGDNAYPDASYADFNSTVFSVYGDLFTRAPVFPALGNREYRTNAAAPSLDIFDLPANAWRADDRERYYSFDYGSAHIVVLDTNIPLAVDDSLSGDDMFDWLRQDLSQTNQRWKIVAFHHPAYSTGPHAVDPRVQAMLVPILEQYGAQLVLSGHDHNYQRTLPLRAGQIETNQDQGIVYIISGAGAAADSPCGTAVWLAFARCSQSYGLYSRITVDGNSLTVEAVNDRGEVEDRLTIGQIIGTPTPTPPSTPTPTPEEELIGLDSFDREVPVSWGSADIGGAYSLTGPPADFAVTGSAGVIRLPSPNATRAAVLTDAFAGDVELTARIRSDKPAADGSQIAYLIARRIAANTEYRGRLRWAADGRVMLTAERVVGGTITVLGGEKLVSGVAPQAGTSIWLRMQIVGTQPTTIRLTAWSDGTIEPNGWLYSVTDSEPSLQVSGAVGLRAYLSSFASNAPVVLSVDDFRVTSPEIVLAPSSLTAARPDATPVALMNGEQLEDRDPI